MPQHPKRDLGDHRNDVVPRVSLQPLAQLVELGDQRLSEQIDRPGPELVDRRAMHPGLAGQLRHAQPVHQPRLGQPDHGREQTLLAAAVLLAANGAAVVVSDIDRAGAELVTKEIQAADGTATAFVADVSDPDVAVALVAAAQELAPLLIAVNNVGIGGAPAPVGEYPIETWRKVIEVNLNSTFYGLRAQIPVIAAIGGGSIVNMASVLGVVGLANHSAYVTSKHALAGLTKNAALEHATQKVRVTAVGPVSSAPRLSKPPSTPRPRPHWPLNTLSADWAPRKKSRRWSPSWPPTRRASSPAATTWSTAAIPPTDR